MSILELAKRASDLTSGSMWKYGPMDEGWSELDSPVFLPKAGQKVFDELLASPI